MIIAVASGKGGTGKTTISQAIAKSQDADVQLLDCDVEEPNAQLFLDIRDKKITDAYVKVPVVDSTKCTLCGKCNEVCQFNAIAVLKDRVMIFDELCHSCGGCGIVCPETAIYEKDNKIGDITIGKQGNITLIEGKLKIKSPTSPPLIREVKKHIKENMLNIIDCPPGNACPVITAISGADFVILITEATPFGLNDLRISVETMKEVGIPFGVIINRSDTGDIGVKDYLIKEHIELLMEIPENLNAAKAYSEGRSITEAMPYLKAEIINMTDKISRKIS